MSDKSKLYVFEKKEVFLLFVFMILVAVTAFAIGVRFGKNYSYKLAGFTNHETQQLELMSGQEEGVDTLMQHKDKIQEENAAVMENTHEKLAEEFEKLDKGDLKKGANPDDKSAPISEEEVMKATSTHPTVSSLKDPMSHKAAPVATPKVEEETVSVMDDKYAGKYTIQLGSHRSKGEAEKFADAFRVRGYSPIISEVELANKGTWYRVSLGVFVSMNDAKAYINKEKSLFVGQDYVVGKFE